MKVSLQHKVAIGYLVASAILFSILMVEFRYIIGLQREAEAIDDTHRVIEHLNYLISQVKDVETGSRGYLVTGQEEFLEPYKAAKDAVPTEIETIKNLVSHDAEQQRRLQSLVELINRKLIFQSEAIQVQKEKGKTAATAMVATGEGRTMMDEIRRVSLEMEQKEVELLSTRIAQKRRSGTAALLGTAASVVCNLLVFGIVFILISREVRQREEAKKALVAFRDQIQYFFRNAGDIISEGLGDFIGIRSDVGDASTTVDKAGAVLGPYSRSASHLGMAMAEPLWRRWPHC